MSCARNFEATNESFNENGSLNFISARDYLVVEGTSHGTISGKSWAGGKTPADVSVTYSSFEMAEFQASTPVSIPITLERMMQGLDGVKIVIGEIVT